MLGLHVQYPHSISHTFFRGAFLSPQDIMSPSFDILKNVETTNLGAVELHSPKERFNVSGREDSTSYEDSNRHGFTRNDRSDMRRMGKRQELMVN